MGLRMDLVVKRKRGRPRREEATARALAAIGVDPASVDPRRILAEIACDRSSPATARVAACRVLLGVDGAAEDVKQPDTKAIDRRVAERAILLMGQRMQ